MISTRVLIIVFVSSVNSCDLYHKLNSSFCVRNKNGKYTCILNITLCGAKYFAIHFQTGIGIVEVCTRYEHHVGNTILFSTELFHDFQFLFRLGQIGDPQKMIGTQGHYG